MRVLLLADLYPPQVGGVERHVQVLGRELARRGHEVTVATVRGDDRTPEDEIDGGVRIRRLRSTIGRLPGAHLEGSRPFAAPAPDPELTVGLARLASAWSPDVVHAHGWIVRSWLPLAPASSAPLVVTAHEYGTVCPRKDLRRLGRVECSGPALEKCLHCAADHYGPARGVPLALAHLGLAPLERRLTTRYIAVSRAVAERNRLPAGRLDVIPNFLPDTDPTPDAASPGWLGQLPGEPFVLYVGALGGHKGFGVLLEAWDRLDDKPPLVAIGHRWADTPPEVPPGVIVLEDWPNEAVRAAWSACLFGVIPSVWAEPFGIVALEAMAAGRPVVASRTGGLAEVVADDETGLLVPAGNAPALAAGIRRLLDNAELRRRLGRAAGSRIRTYRASAIVPRIEGVYAAAVEARRMTRDGQATRPSA